MNKNQVVHINQVVVICAETKWIANETFPQRHLSCLLPCIYIKVSNYTVICTYILTLYIVYQQYNIFDFFPMEHNITYCPIKRDFFYIIQCTILDSRGYLRLNSKLTSFKWLENVFAYTAVCDQLWTQLSSLFQTIIM